jgi:hypothetical protein
MDQTIGKTKGGFAFWWCNKESAGWLRFFLLAMVFIGGSVFWVNAKVSAMRAEFPDYAAPADLYVPATITGPNIDIGGLAFTTVNSRAYFALVDRTCQQHFMQSKRFDEQDVLEVTYVAKFNNESTNIYRYSEGIYPKPVSYWFHFVPTELSLEGNVPIIKWHISLKHAVDFGPGIAIGLILLAGMCTLAINGWLRKLWVGKLQPQ